MSAHHEEISNLLVRALPARERKRLLAHCSQVELVFGTVVCEAKQPMRYLYFPLKGFISLVTGLAGHRPLELGLIGHEGMLGATQILGVKAAPSTAVVQGAGSALRISTNQLRKVLDDCPRLLQTLKRYLYVQTVQLAQNAACGHFHELEPRLARWLLMTHDRAHSDHFHLTHEFLADMLGVRRSGVTIAAGALQLRKLIHYNRGEISVLDRPGLEQVACACYAALSADYERQFPAASDR